MRNKGIIIGILGLMVLGVFAYFALVKNESVDTLNRNEADFAVKDTASVSKVFLSSKAGANYTMVRLADGSGWELKDMYKLRNDKANLILGTLHDLEVKRPVTNAERNQVIKTLAATGLKIEIYREDKLDKVMYLGGETSAYDGSYAYIPDAESPYVVGLPYMNGIVITRFNIAESNWRKSEIFNVPGYGIERMEIKYNSNPAQNVTIDLSRGNMSIAGVSELDTLKLMNYLDQFRNVNAQNYVPKEDEQAYLDTLQSYGTLAEITITPKGNAPARTLILYDQIPTYNDILFGKMKDEDELMVVQHFVIDKLMVTPQAFSRSEATSPSI